MRSGRVARIALQFGSVCRAYIDAARSIIVHSSESIASWLTCAELSRCGVVYVYTGRWLCFVHGHTGVYMAVAINSGTMDNFWLVYLLQL